MADHVAGIHVGVVRLGGDACAKLLLAPAAMVIIALLGGSDAHRACAASSMTAVQTDELRPRRPLRLAVARQWVVSTVSKIDVVAGSRVDGQTPRGYRRRAAVMVADTLPASTYTSSLGAATLDAAARRAGGDGDHGAVGQRDGHR